MWSISTSNAEGGNTNPSPMAVKSSKDFSWFLALKIALTIQLSFSRSDYVRQTRQLGGHENEDDLVFSDDIHASATSNSKKSAASEQVPVRLEFPGNDYTRPKRATLSKGN